MLKRLYGVNFFDAYISGAVTVAIPLMMLQYGVEIAAIGLVFSFSPLVKLAVRLIAAAVADSTGDKIIYVISSFFNLAQAICYGFFPSTLGFLAGKSIDGARESLLFSVNRISVMAVVPHRGHFALAGMMSGRFLYNAIGSLSVGLLFAAGGFDMILLALAVLSSIMLFLSMGVINHRVHRGQANLNDFSPFGKSRMFYEATRALTLGGSFYMAMLYFAMPLFLGLNGYSLGQIGVFYAAYFLILGITLNFLSHRQIPTGAAAAAGTIIFVICLMGMTIADSGFLPFLFLGMAFGDGCLGLLWEEANYLAIRDSKKRAIDLALAGTPAGIAVFLVSALSGFAISKFGFAPLFFLTALSLIGFSAMCVRLSKMK